MGKDQLERFDMHPYNRLFIKKSKFQRQRIKWDQSLKRKKDCRTNIFFIAGEQISNNLCIGRPIIAQCAWSRPTA